MTILKCKMCGGDIEVNANTTVETCRFCGITSTIPKAVDDRRANLYNRANYYRRAHEFDKARLVYDNILNEDDTEAEAHWGVVLCQYGIEYVEEPGAFVKIPMSYRMQAESIMQEAHYKAACHHADTIAREIYIKEAERADAILKKLMEVSSKEEPYDVFICYKDMDESNQPTRDSVLAQEIYDELTKIGYKVFLARKALAGKHRNAFEPIIYAALHSSKAMLVVGTKAEHFNAPWVRNEWNRFLELIKNGANKIIIPTYRDVDPYDIPDALGNLLALNMVKLGFIQSLYDSLSKVFLKAAETTDKTPQLIELKGPSVRLESLLKRGMLFLEDGEFTKADDYFERVLDENPEEDRAYWGKLLAKLECKSNQDIIKHEQPLGDYDEYKKALRFSNAEQTEVYLKIEREREIVVFAILDSAETLYESGCKYYEGDGVPKNEQKAFERFSKAAEKGYTEAEEVLGAFYERGIAVAKDHVKAAEWYSKAAGKGSQSACLNLGNLYYNNDFGTGNEHKMAFKWFTKCAERGDASAQCMVGVCYYYNKGVQNDFKKAFEWFSKAADNGNIDAEYYLGLCYQEGNGVKRDISKAEELIASAAKQGHILAGSTFFVTSGAVISISCPKCGKKQMSNRDFCWKCGEKFTLVKTDMIVVKDDNIYLKCMEI